MRALLLPLVLVIATLLPAFAQQTATAGDRALDLIGTWSCQSFAHSKGTWTYVRTADGKISMRNHFTTDTGLSGEFDETYAQNASGQWVWTATVPDRPGFVETASAGPWTSDTWTFQGRTDIVTPATGDSIAPPSHYSQQLRMVYTALAPGAFRRELEAFRAGRWVNTNGSTCTRADVSPKA